jgi:enoyl-CoA hydratase/carnithine racemase
MTTAQAWTPSSWRALPARHQPEWPEPASVDAAREQLAALPPLAYAAVKEGLRRGAESSMEKEWATNVLAQTMLLGTQDFAEGLAAVVERRPGVFTGQ